ncbi:MAG: metallophosphoesterase family protein, partial [Bacteroidaceae bacterium]|nr:metallophosphoesterase family protein [Bacteroidaceae bacterium]
MKLFVFSDPHGDLPNTTEHYDVVCCCGDFSPLQYQRSFSLMMNWIEYDFCSWIKNIDCDKFIFIAGNHDFCCEKPEFKESFQTILEYNGLADKVVYLQNESYLYKNKKFFGCPYSDIYGWAFSMCDAEEDGGYHKIEDDVDVLLVHQAPDINNVGTSDFNKPWGRNFGSHSLLNVIWEKKPEYVFCGHIHSGNHKKTVLDNTVIYNTSIKNEEYKIAYLPLIIEI